jgi:hypothetical protein
MKKPAPSPAGASHPTQGRTALLEQFRARVRNVNRSLDELDVHGTESPKDQQVFWDGLVLDGAELVAAFRRLVQCQGGSARDRMLCYLQKHAGQVVEGSTLESVAGISAWARRIRELDVELGYNIATNVTDPTLHPGQYRLDSREPDGARAEWWQFKHSLRTDPSKPVHQKLLALLLKKVGRPVDAADLEYVAAQKEWTRRLRELRSEHGGWRVSSYLNCSTLKSNQYTLESSQEIPLPFRVNADLWSKVLERDRFTCRKCGWSKNDAPTAERHCLEVLPQRISRPTTAEPVDSLETLCNHCYEQRCAQLAGSDGTGNS